MNISKKPKYTVTSGHPENCECYACRRNDRENPYTGHKYFCSCNECFFGPLLDDSESEDADMETENVIVAAEGESGEKETECASEITFGSTVHFDLPLRHSDFRIPTYITVNLPPIQLTESEKTDQTPLPVLYNQRNHIEKEKIDD